MGLGLGVGLGGDEDLARRRHCAARGTLDRELGTYRHGRLQCTCNMRCTCSVCALCM